MKKNNLLPFAVAASLGAWVQDKGGLGAWTRHKGGRLPLATAASLAAWVRDKGGRLLLAMAASAGTWARDKGGRLLLAMALSAGAWAQDKGLPLPASGNVTLPLDEYNHLVELAGKPVKKPELPPVPYIVKSAEMTFHVAGESATGTIQLEGEVFRKGAIQVPLASGMTLLDARQKGTELPLEQAGGTHMAVLPGPGEFSVTLDAGMPLGVEAGRASLNFPAPAAGAARLTLVIPGDHTVVQINPGLITARTSANGQTTVEATLVPGQPVNIWWAVREAAVQPAAPREVRFLSDVKTLASVSEAELALTALVDITVVQGDPAQFSIALPAGYELTGASGASLDASDVEGGLLTLRVLNAALRSHQFLISLTKANTTPRAEVPILSLQNTQRETGEVLVEGEGTMELTAKEGGSLKRMDLKEVSPYLRSLARNPLHAAFRYHRQASETPELALEWVRFPDSSVLAAVAEEATVTTMVTSDGKSLTEVKLTVRNQAQPFLKVALPAGASIVSADVAGERVKPVQGADGSRVPLLRSGFRPAGSYTISFVYMDSGAPFAKKGGSELALPKMDVPIGLVRWEVFLPDRYKVTNFGGDALAANLLPEGAEMPAERKVLAVGPLFHGQIGGIVTDPSGAVVPRAHVTVIDVASGASKNTDADDNGRWVVSNVTSGKLRVMVNAPGFRTGASMVDYNSNHPGLYPTTLQVGAVTESVEVMSSAATIDSVSPNRAGRGSRIAAAPPPPPAAAAAPAPFDKKQDEQAQAAASSNVLNLQKRVAGVLPIPIDVPRAGTSFRFVRPLVVDEETRVTFSYKTK